MGQKWRRDFNEVPNVPVLLFFRAFRAFSDLPFRFESATEGLCQLNGNYTSQCVN